MVKTKTAKIVLAVLALVVFAGIALSISLIGANDQSANSAMAGSAGEIYENAPAGVTLGSASGTVAKIGDTGYESLPAAVAAAKDGETVVLVKDTTLTNSDIVPVGKYNAMVNVTGKNITLNLNGKKITVEYVGNSLLYSVIRIDEAAGLTVTGKGSIDVPSNGYHVAYMFWKAGDTGYLNIKNGNFHMNDSADSIVYSNGDKIVTVSGGNFAIDTVGTRVNDFPVIFNAQGNNQRSIVVTGGTYNYDVSHQHWQKEVFIPENTPVKDNGNGTWTVGNAVVVATVGDAEFATLTEAIDAAKNGDTVVLVEDIELTDEDIIPVGEYTTMVNVDGKEITLDLNGKKITTLYTGGKYLFSVIRVGDEAGLTVTGNGYIDVPSNGINVAYTFWKTGTAGYLTIENGNFHMEDSADSIVYSNGDDTVTVNGGYFAIDTVGTRVNQFPVIFNAQGNNQRSITVKGGTFNFNVSKQHWKHEVNIADGKAVVDNGDGTWTVENYDNVVAVIEDNGFRTLTDAIDAAKNGDTVVLVKDITFTDSDIINVGDYTTMVNVDGKEITLDLNGKKITTLYTGGKYLYSVIRVGDEAGLTVTGNGYIDVPSNGINVAYTFWKAGTAGYLTIENGNFHMEDSADSIVYSNGDDTVTVNGGYFAIDTVGTRVNQFPVIFNAQGNNQRSITVKGGTFNFNVAKQHWKHEVNIADGKAVVDNGNGTWTVENYDNVVAVIEDNGFRTLTDAIDAAKNGDTVVLVKDITFTDSDIINVGDYTTMVNVDGKEITLDLNGKKITTLYTGGKYLYSVIRVGDEAGLTVTGNGYIDVPSNGINVAYTFWKAGTAGYLTIENGNFLMEDSADSIVYSNGDDTVTVNGGYFAIDTVGTRVNQFPVIFNAQGNNQKSITVKGGTYNFDISKQHWKYEVNLADGKAVVDNGDGTWSVVEDPTFGMAAMVEYEDGSVVYFNDFKDAFAATENGSVLTLLADIILDKNDVVALDGYVTFLKVENKTLTVDLNGCTLSGDAAGIDKMVVGMFATVGSELTLIDSSEGKTGTVKIDANGAKVYALLVNYNTSLISVYGGNYLLDVASDSLMYTAVNEGIVIYGGTFNLGNVGTGVNRSPWVFNAKGQNTAHVLVYGGTFNADIQHQYYPFEVHVPKELALKKDNGTFTVVAAVAYVTEREWSGAWYTNNIGYATLQEALDACEGPKKSYNGKWSEQEEVILIGD